MLKNKNFLLGIGVSNLSKDEILEEIKKWLEKEKGFCQIVTVNPEIMVEASKNKRFKKVLNDAQFATADGIGVILAGKVLGLAFKEKITGVDLMKEMIKIASDLGLTVGLIGGRGQVALKAAECLKKGYPNFKFFALEGAKDIKKETPREREKTISIMLENKPQMLFVAFGAPWQEFFIDSLKKDLRVTRHPLPALIAVGVGGAFDEISGRAKKVPKWIENLGFKWLWRLFCQPWRLRRQLALLEFTFLVLREFLKKSLQRRRTSVKLYA